MTVSIAPTEVERDKWDTEAYPRKCLTLTRQKELYMAKVSRTDEQKAHKFTDEEIKRLAQFFDILIEIDTKEKARFRRLEQEPKGYSMSGEGRNCSLCGRGVCEDGWFDKWGFKCLNCQNAIDKRRIPGSLCRDWEHERSITDTALAIELGINVQTIRKLIREDKIIGRKIPGGPYIILRKDNPDLKNVLVQPAK